jgi:hypothetical protein
MAALSTQRVPLSPALPASPGIVLALAPRPQPLSPLLVHGAFLLDPATAEAIGGEPHRGIVVVVQHGEAHSAYTPFRDPVLFADDVAHGPRGVEGYFTLDVFALQGSFAPGPYHVLVSMGELVSPVVETFVK